MQDSLMMNQSQINGIIQTEDAASGLDDTQPIQQSDETKPDMIEEQIIKGFSEDLTRKDFEESLKEVEESLKQLTKASITELRQFAKPHYLVEKAMQVVCALKGFKVYNWSLAKELLQRP